MCALYQHEYNTHQWGQGTRTKLSCPRPVNGRVRPIIRPVHLFGLPQSKDRLDRERHPGLARANRLVLAVVGDPRGRVEVGVDAVPAPGRDDVAVPRLGVLLDGVAELAERGTRLHELDGLVQALAGRLDDPHVVGVGLGSVADVVGLVEVGVVAFVVDGDVEVENIAVQEDSLVGDSVADDLVGRGAKRLGEVVVVERRRVRLLVRIVSDRA